MSINQVIEVNGVLGDIHQQGGDDYISLMDLAKQELAIAKEWK